MVTIGIDNTVAISATHAIKPSASHYIWDTFHRRVAMLYNRHKGVDVLVKWSPGHMGILGNEKADEEARKAALEGSSPADELPAPLRKTLPRSKAVTQQEYMHKLKVSAEKLWKSSPRYERMAHLDLNIKLNKYAKLSNSLHRDQASLLFQLRTGHIPLNTYLYYKIRKSVSPICPNCRQHNKTVLHYILHCSAFNDARKYLY